MLSILPFERIAAASSSSSSNRDPERPFKAYPNHPSSLYPSYSHASFLGSVLPPTSSVRDGMDLRTQNPYDTHSIPTSAATAHQIKQEMDNMQHHYSSYNGYHHSYPSHMQMSGMSNHGAAAIMGNSMSQAAAMGHHNGLSLPTTPVSDPSNGSSHNMHGLNHNGGSLSTSGHALNSPPGHGGNTPSHAQQIDSKSSLQNLSSEGSPSNTHNSSDSASPSSKPPSKKRNTSRVCEDLKDETYWEKRKKNNDSAKRSRESRRAKEEQIAMRVVYLEQENLQLRTECGLLKSEIEKLRCMLYNA